MSEEGPLSDDQRKGVYISLLTGLARSIREAPGSCDRIGHDWSRWVQTAHYPDLPMARTSSVVNFNVKVSAERKCDICGKVERS